MTKSQINQIINPTEASTVDLEIWADVLDYEGLYEISNLGNVREIKQGAACSIVKLKERKSKTNLSCITVDLVKRGFTRNRAVHILMAEVFLSKPPAKEAFVYHVNRNRADNRLFNLTWKTHKQLLTERIETLVEKLEQKTIRQINHLINCKIEHEGIAEFFGLPEDVIDFIATNRI